MPLSLDEFARAQATRVALQGLLIALIQNPLTAGVADAAKTAALQIAALADGVDRSGAGQELSLAVYRELEDIFRVVKPGA